MHTGGHSKLSGRKATWVRCPRRVRREYRVEPVEGVVSFLVTPKARPPVNGPEIRQRRALALTYPIPVTLFRW